MYLQYFHFPYCIRRLQTDIKHNIVILLEIALNVEFPYNFFLARDGGTIVLLHLKGYKK